MITVKELYHHGIPGMHWYDRRFQNYDGSLTEEGRKRYGVGEAVKTAANIGKKTIQTGKEISAKRKEKRERKRIEERRKFLMTANADEIEQYMKKHKGDLTMDELKTLTSRFAFEKQIHERASAVRNANSKWNKLKKVTDSVKTINDFWDQGNRTLNNVTNTADAVKKVAKLTGHQKEAAEVEKATEILKKANIISKNASERMSRAADRIEDAADRSEAKVTASSVKEVAKAEKLIEDATRSVVMKEISSAVSSGSFPDDLTNHVTRGREKRLMRNVTNKNAKSTKKRK